MTITLATRKPVNALGAADFRAFPVWEYAIDEEGRSGQDETWVRLVAQPQVRKGAYSQLVAAGFLTPSDQRLGGFVVVTTAEVPAELIPGAVLGDFGYQVLPALSRQAAQERDLTWCNHARDSLLEAMGLPEPQVFPLRYTLRAIIRGEKAARTGVVE